MKSKISKNAISHEFTVKISEEHLDELNHVNNITYLKWVQDASAIHWNLLADDIIKNQVLWVVLRHEIDYKRQAFLHDDIKVITWVGESTGVKSIRYVNFYEQDKIVASCKTTWCLLDKSTLKPKRIEGAVLKLLTTD